MTPFLVVTETTQFGGGNGDDIITGGAGADDIDVGSGSNTVIFNSVKLIGSDSYNGSKDRLSNMSDDDLIQLNVANIDIFSVNSNVSISGPYYLVDIDGDNWPFGLHPDSSTNSGDILAIVYEWQNRPSIFAQERTVVNLSGTTGNDALTAGVNDDTISSGGGNDTITGGAGADVIDGGIGFDTVSYVDVTSASSHGLANISGMAVNLSAAAVTAATIATAMGGTVVIGGGDGVAGGDLAAGSAGYLATTAANSTLTMVRDTISNVEAVVGSALADYIALGAGGMAAEGGAGNDVIIGGAGNDTITGGAGVDTINVGIGLDVVVIGTVATADIDVITGFTSNDFIAFQGGLTYQIDTNPYNSGTYVDLANALNYVLSGAGNTQPAAIGFSYDAIQYVVIDADGDGIYDAADDAVVQLFGTDLASLTAGNFIA